MKKGGFNMNIKAQINELESKKKELQASSSRKGFWLRLASIFTVGGGIAALFTAPLAGISMLGATAALLAAETRNTIKTENKMHRLIAEQKKLVNIAKNGVDNSNQAKVNRTKYINQTKKDLSELNQTYQGSKRVGSLINLGILVGSFAGAIAMGPLSFVAPVLAGVKMIQNKTLVQKEEAMEAGTRELHNTEYEQLYSNQYPRNNIRTNMKQPVKTNQKTNTKQMNHTARPVERVTTRPTTKQSTNPTLQQYYDSIFNKGTTYTESKGAYQKVR